MAKVVIIILTLSPTHFASNIHHQHVTLKTIATYPTQLGNRLTRLPVIKRRKKEKINRGFQNCTYVLFLYANDYWIIFNLGAVLISTIKFLTCQKITPRLYHNFILFPHQAFLLSLYQHFLFIICSVKNGYRSISILNNKNLSYRPADLLEGILMDADSLILLANRRSWFNWSK